MERVFGSNPGIRYLLVNTPLLKGYGIRSAVVLANIKDNIGSFEAHHMLKLLKILWPWKI